MSPITSSSSSNTFEVRRGSSNHMLKKRKLKEAFEDIEESERTRFHYESSDALQGRVTISSNNQGPGVSLFWKLDDDLEIPLFINRFNDSDHWIFPNPPDYPQMGYAAYGRYSTFHRIENVEFSGNAKMEETEWKKIQPYLPVQLQNQKGRDILDTIIQLYLCVDVHYNPYLDDLNVIVQQRLKDLVLVHASRFFRRFVGFFQAYSIGDGYMNFRNNTPLFRGIERDQYQMFKGIWKKNQLKQCPAKKCINACIARALAWSDQKIEESSMFCLKPFLLNKYLNRLLKNNPYAFSLLIQTIHKILKSDEELSKLLPSLSFYLL